MVILKWLNSVRSGNRTELQQAAAGKAADEVKKGKKANSVNLVNATLVDQAENLEELIASGSPFIERRRLKQKIKKKVKKAIWEEFSDPKVIDEITDRITDVAEVDPYYKKLFCKDSE